MHIAVSLLNFRPGKIGGTETYLRQLVAAWPALKGDDRITLVVYRDIAESIRQAAGDALGIAVVNRNDAQIVRARVMEAFAPYRARFAERVFAELAPDVVFFPQQSLFPKRVAAPAVLTVHDVQHLFHPENFGLFDRLFRPAIYPLSMERARRIITISEFTKKTLVERCGVDAGKITTIHSGAAPVDASKIEPYPGLPEPYLYYPAATHAHKGHADLLAAFSTLKKVYSIPHTLVLTGQQTPVWRRLLLPLIRGLGIERDVHHLGFVSYADVQRLYRGAAAVVFPTRFEGFGLPVVEAAAFGKKIITSRLEVFDEIGVPRRFQIDFTDPKQINEFKRALDLPGPTLLERPPMTWEQTARDTLAVLRAVGRLKV